MNELLSPTYQTIESDTPGDFYTQLTVVNTGAEKDVVIKQYVGSHFTVEDFTPTDGSVTLTPMPNGRTLVTWSVHLEVWETVYLTLHEHTDGISVHHCHEMTVELVSSPWVEECGWMGGDPIDVLVVHSCCCDSEEGPSAQGEAIF